MGEDIRMCKTEKEIERYRTPYRCPKPVLTGSGRPGSFDSQGVDCPFVFFHNGAYHMLYIGFDGTGYQTGLAVSSDLLRWEHKGLVIRRQMDSGRWDRLGGAGVWLLKESDSIWEVPRLRKLDGKYWMVYHAYPGDGYESGPGEIALAWTEDEELMDWHLPDRPQFSWRDGEAWERGGLYKSSIVEQDGVFYMFYNAKDQAEDWTEQIGVACSRDLIHWVRGAENPVLKVTPGAWDETFNADPYVVQDGQQWLMFYYGLGGAGTDGICHAQEGLAVSGDLVHWEKAPDPILAAGRPGSIDCGHVHKPSVFYENGVLYHFYCATRPWQDGDATSRDGEFRTICVAASRPVWDCMEAEVNEEARGARW